MANEAKGNLYEVITEIALEKAINIARIKGALYRNQKPEGLSIIPDFTIGLSPNQPTHLFLVTGSEASNSSHKKFWRNLAELQEAKIQLETIPIVVNIYFKSEVKQGISDASEYIYDYTIHTNSKSYGVVLENWVSINTKNLSKNNEDRKQLLLKELSTNLELSIAIEDLSEDLALSVKSRKHELIPLWNLMREDYSPAQPFPKIKTTYIRRGLGKLTVIEPEIRKLIYNAEVNRKAIPVAKLPKYVFDLSFLNRSIAGARLTDNEIIDVIKLLGGESCELILNKLPETANLWINSLRDISKIEAHADFVQENYEKFINPNQYKQLLLECFNDPSKLSGVNDDKVWTYEIIISLLKAKSKKLQGYGLAQLSADTAIAEKGKGAPLLRFIIPQFVQREKNLKADILEKLSLGLSKKFSKEVLQTDIPKLKNQLLTVTIKENLYDRLIPYWKFDPIFWLLEDELKKQGKHYSTKSNYVGWLNEYTQSGKSVATTSFVKVGNTLIHWKSSYGSHTNDKTKELCARARNVKYQYISSAQTFTRRLEAKRLALIIDGEWTNRNLQTLTEQGWDLIIYPDEIPDLVNKLQINIS